MSEKLEWGLTKHCFVEDTWCHRPDKSDEGYLDALKAIVACLTVNGVPLADVLERAANELFSEQFVPVRHTHAAVLRALVGRDSDEATLNS